jgi:TolB-like protein
MHVHLHLFHRCFFAIVFASLFSFAAGAASAGHVITDELRQWARDAVAGESALDTRAAPNTVGILYFDNKTRRSELDPLQKGLTLMLITDLAKIDTIQVVERSRLQALVDELELSTSGLVDSATGPRVGQLLGAAYLVGGQLLQAEQAVIHIDSNLLRVARQDTLGNPASSGPFEELLRMEKEILFEIVRLLGLELTEAQVRELQKPLTTNMKTLMSWFQGIALSDRQEYRRAAASYQRAIQADPSFKPAADAIDELKQLKLILAPPPTREVLQRLHNQVSVNTSPVPDTITKRDDGPASQTTDVTVQWR